jgi:cyclic pyranopterin phosphate synthase
VLGEGGAGGSPGASAAAPVQLIDGQGRAITDLRISVTDRCNLRCVYCLPARGARFLAPGRLLSFGEIARLAAVAVGLGIRKLRLTGGEPLVRADLDRLVARLCAIPGVADVPLTTNGVLLAGQAEALYAAGARRLNISLDAVEAGAFQRMTRAPALRAVLVGIAAARRAGFRDIKLNMIPIRGQNEDQILPLARWAVDEGLHLRFIEYMPFGANPWSPEQMLSAKEVHRRLGEAFSLGPGRRASPSSPAVDHQVLGTGAYLGFIPSMTAPFCPNCSRLRLTADGRLRPCLHADTEIDVAAALRAGAPPERLRGLLRLAAASKPPGRVLAAPGKPPQQRRFMASVGG